MSNHKREINSQPVQPRSLGDALGLQDIFGNKKFQMKEMLFILVYVNEDLRKTHNFAKKKKKKSGLYLLTGSLKSHQSPITMDQ